MRLNCVFDHFTQTIETAFGLRVRYDGGDTAYIEVPYTYWNNTCGLCGTFDDDRNNEYRLQDGSLVSSHETTNYGS